MTETIDILLTGPLPNKTADGLDKAFTVYRPFTGAEQKTKLEKVADKVRGVAAGESHERLDDAFLAASRSSRFSRPSASATTISTPKGGRRAGIIVTNTPDVLTEEVADTAMGLLLCTVRQFPQADALFARRQMGRRPHSPSPDTCAAGPSASPASGASAWRSPGAPRHSALPVVYHSR